MASKKEIIDALKNKILADIAHYEKMYEDARLRSNESEGRNQTRYDTQKMETAYEANAYARKVLELQQNFQMLKEMEEMKDVSTVHTVQLGSLVDVEIQKDGEIQKQKYYIVSNTGGITFPDFNLMTISFASPLSKALLGKKAGDEFELKMGSKITKGKIFAVK